MEFNSLKFAIFFALLVLLYFAPFMRRAWRQNMLVLAGSYLFYGCWDWRFLGLILLTTVTSFFTGIVVEKHGRSGRIALIANIVLNIGILCAFKYCNFFGENIAWLLSWLGWEVDWVFLNILLPVGISFYTFQAIGYTVDVWRGELPATRDPLLFATYIAYFPQLVAGPIEKAARLLPQLSVTHHWHYPRAVSGLRQILWGLLKKIAIADPAGSWVSEIYGADDPSGISIYLATVLFAIQVYCDFSGYCDIAQGTARILGVELMDNFRRPYFSRSFLEFWQRWHISLMRWFTSYVYIPLGGSRRGPVMTYVNIFIVFALSGLWHGAAWNLVLFGVVSGLVCMAERLIGVKSYKGAPPASFRDLPQVLRMFLIYLSVVIFFRQPSPGMALEWNLRYLLPYSAIIYIGFMTLWTIFTKMSFFSDETGKRAGGILPRVAPWPLFLLVASASAVVLALVFRQEFWFHLYWFSGIVLLACEWHTRHCGIDLCPYPRQRRLRFVCYYLIYFVILAYGFLTLPPAANDTQFIYFQF